MIWIICLFAFLAANFCSRSTTAFLDHGLWWFMGHRSLWDARVPCCATYEAFINEMRWVWSLILGMPSSRSSTQVKSRVSLHAWLCCWFQDSGSHLWLGSAGTLWLHGLADQIKDELVARELPSTLQELMDLAKCIDTHFNLLHALLWHTTRTHANWSHAYLPEGVPALLQWGFLFLLWSSRSFGMILPLKSLGPQVILGVQGWPHTDSWPLFLVTLTYDKLSHIMNALEDSGADQNLIAASTINRLKIPSIPLSQPFHIQALDGSKLPPITHCSAQLTLQLSGNLPPDH